MEFRDYYEILGVPRDADADAVRKAFRRKARKYHPDVSKEKDADARMKEVNEAYEVLSDPEKRMAYDRLGQGFQNGQDFQPPPDWDTGFEFSGSGFGNAQAADFSDFFAEIFGRRPAGGGPRARSPGGHYSTRGEDRHAKVMLDVEDAYQGATRTLTLSVPKVDDRGRVGLVDHNLNVRIPKGVREGQVIRLAGQGEAGVGGGPAGDLFLEVHFKPHPRFRVEERDVYLTLPVTPWEAALGGRIKATVPDGAVEVRVPAGSQSGRKLRLKGRGIPGTPPGDLYLMLDIVLPPATSARARELYETMAKDLAFNPRQGTGG